jgi:hypothetical protein
MWGLLSMLDRLLTGLLLASLILGVAAWVKKERYADAGTVRPELLQAPKQSATSEPPFSIYYEGTTYSVKPLAKYDLYGLVVSHNNIESIADLQHDATSLDTKDLCVVWGDNLRSNEFNKVDIHNASYTCFFRYEQGVKFHHNQLSNNHLIAGEQFIRDKIEEIGVGDQVHIKGLLVSYQAPGWGSFWRQSSLTRDDTGNGACEVLYVKSIDIYDAPRSRWQAAFWWGWMSVMILLVIKFALAWHRA